MMVKHLFEFSKEARKTSFVYKDINTCPTTERLPEEDRDSKLYKQKMLRELFGEREALVHSIAEEHNVDPALVFGVIVQESNGDPHAESPAGAKGAMMLMDQTAEDKGVKDVFNFCENVKGGTDFLARLINNFGEVRLALAAYNYGPGNVKKLMQEHGVEAYEDLVDYLPAETVEYVPKVLAYASDARGVFPAERVTTRKILGTFTSL